MMGKGKLSLWSFLLTMGVMLFGVSSMAFAGEAVALLYAPDVIGSLRAQETAASLLTTYCTLVIAVVFGIQSAGLGILLAFDAIFVTVCWLLFDFVAAGQEN